MARLNSFQSYFLGGFECSTHRRRVDGARLDVIASTRHDVNVQTDYSLLRRAGIDACRDGIRWHLIERTAKQYDLSSVLPMVRAARDTGMQVIWDLCHYGWPDDLDIFSAAFVDRFASLSRAVAQLIASETGDFPWFAPINEISFFAWASGEVGCFHPFAVNRGTELKKQLVRASIAAIEAIRDVCPHARFLQVDPVINVVARENASLAEKESAALRTRSQYEAWDMLSGRMYPELGGAPRYLDVIGCNYYVHNQWIVDGPSMERSHPRYRPLQSLLVDVWRRYRRPMIIAETGIEDRWRAEWLRYVSGEVIAALKAGVPVGGVCLYPIVNHPGWDDGRHCHNGLWDYCNTSGEREIYKPLAAELSRQQTRLHVFQLEHQAAHQKVAAASAQPHHLTEESQMQDPTRSVAVVPSDIVCLSHLRWGFVYQRPQHLLSRFARHGRVFFVEEPVPTDGTPRLEIYKCPESGVNIVVPQMPQDLSASTQETIQKLLINNLLLEQKISSYVLWYYTPMALAFSSHLKPAFTVFDCMDELSAFKDAPQELKDLEAELMRRADIVFTGGQSLYEAKAGRHAHLHAFPSSIDYAHFAQARNPAHEPEDQASIPHPRVGFAGVIDERMNLELLDGIASLRPDIQFIMIGPVVKISESSLPRRANIHYLGGRSYRDLPDYLAGWDAAMMPFAHNESTRFISPTKTPEYLAAGKPVVSTSITDVVRPYGVQKLVRIADKPAEFAAALDAALTVDAIDPEWMARRDAFLARNSWDITWQQMVELMEARAVAKELEPMPLSLRASPAQIASMGD